MDVDIILTRINLPLTNNQEDLQISSVDMLFRLDGIALEANETFTLNFTFPNGAFGIDPILRRTFSGTIIDADSKIQSLANVCIYER